MGSASRQIYFVFYIFLWVVSSRLPWSVSAHYTLRLQAQAPTRGFSLAPAMAPSPVGDPDSLIPLLSPSPLIPVFPNPSAPKLSGRCPLNFSSVTQTIERTAQDCLAPLALYVGNVICCPQYESMGRIIQGQHMNKTGLSGLNATEAEYCFSDSLNLLVSKGANTSLPELCSAHSTDFTQRSCPVTSMADFQHIVNTSGLLEACQSVDPLKECCKPVCQPAITEAASQLFSNSSSKSLKSNELTITSNGGKVLEDCRNVVLAWMASQLSPGDANVVLRNLYSCKVNEDCPLSFSDASSVIDDCGGSSIHSTTCCNALHKYISEMQQQKLITNLQALECVTQLSSMLRSKGVTHNLYDLCTVNLKDFSLQVVGDQGCLLNSLPSDVIVNASDITFTCDLNDNIAAPWHPLSTCSVSAPKYPKSAVPLSSGSDRISTPFLFSFLVVMIPLVQFLCDIVTSEGSKHK